MEALIFWPRFIIFRYLEIQNIIFLLVFVHYLLRDQYDIRFGLYCCTTLMIFPLKITGHGNKSLLDLRADYRSNKSSSAFPSISSTVQGPFATSLTIGLVTICCFSVLLIALCFLRRKSFSKLLRPSNAKAKVKSVLS
jgi:hypothetical protein